MAATAWVVHDKAKEKALIGEVDYDSDTFVVRLYLSTSGITTTTVSDASSEDSDEVTNANGYTTGGEATTCTVTETAGTTKVDFTDAVWNATSSGITCRYAALVDTTLTPDEVIASCSLDTSDVTASAGNQFTVQFHADGAFQVS